MDGTGEGSRREPKSRERRFRSFSGNILLFFSFPFFIFFPLSIISNDVKFFILFFSYFCDISILFLYYFCNIFILFLFYFCDIFIFFSSLLSSSFYLIFILSFVFIVCCLHTRVLFLLGLIFSLIRTLSKPRPLKFRAQRKEISRCVIYVFP